MTYSAVTSDWRRRIKFQSDNRYKRGALFQNKLKETLTNKEEKNNFPLFTKGSRESHRTLVVMRTKKGI